MYGTDYHLAFDDNGEYSTRCCLRNQVLEIETLNFASISKGILEIRLTGM